MDALVAVPKAGDIMATRPAKGTVTFRFTNLAGSTKTLQRLWGRAAEALRSSHFRLVREAVAADEGPTYVTQHETLTGRPGHA